MFVSIPRAWKSQAWLGEGGTDFVVSPLGRASGSLFNLLMVFGLCKVVVLSCSMSLC